MAFGGRFDHLPDSLLGLGGSANLLGHLRVGTLDYVFDLVWIRSGRWRVPPAAGITLRHFQRKDLYSMGQSAVLLGLLSCRRWAYGHIDCGISDCRGISINLACKLPNSRRCLKYRVV